MYKVEYWGIKSKGLEMGEIIQRLKIKEQARSGKDASSTYLYVERIPRYLHIAGLIVNITFHG